MSSGAATPAGRRRVADRGARAARATPKPAAPKPKQEPKARAAAPQKAPAGPRRAPRPRARPPRRRRPRAGASSGGRRWRWPALPRPWRRLGSGRSRRRWAIGAVVLALALTALYYGWFRDSSLVAVDKVAVVGLDGVDGSGPAAAALRSAGEGMTTLDVDQGRLESVAAQYPEIGSLSADPHFPHGLTINVTPRRPVLVAHDGGRAVPVAGDGTLLVGVPATAVSKLPSLAVHPLPASGLLTGTALEQALVLGAAPAPFRREVRGVSYDRDHGVTATMRGGIGIRFGAPTDARDKWAAAAAVLADRRVTTLAYVDVRVPRRPAVG